MSGERQSSKPTLNEIVTDIRQETLDERAVEQASQRVWARVAEHLQSSEMAASPNVERIRSCADFQALVPAYLAGTLSEARALLLKDHVHECVACRHALEAVRGLPRAVVRSADLRSRERTPSLRRFGWAVACAIAAMLLVVVGLRWAGGGRLWELFGGAGIQAQVQAVNGALYRVFGQGSVSLSAGGAILKDQEIRTAHASSAMIRLADGSTVEMNQRTDLWISHGWRGTTIHLRGGNIIVQAAKQPHGRLYVATKHCLVSVKGTVFAVDEGMKGSRVSVIRGEVEVAQGRRTRILHPGEQMSTEASLAPVPLARDIAWSGNAGEYLAVLSEFAALHKQLDAIPGPAPRYDSTLLKLVPADTVFYAAIPNIGSELAEANRLLQERIQQSEVLQQWWKRQQASGEAQKQTDMMDRIRSFSDYLGNEIVVAVAAEQHGPLVLAEVKRPDFSAFLQEQLSQLKSEGKEPKVFIVDDPFSFQLSASGKDTALVYLKNNVLVVATDLLQLQRVATLIERSSPSSFTSTPFFAAIQKAYQSGAGWLLCADMEQILSHSVGKEESSRKGFEPLRDERTGLADMRYLIMESKDVNGKKENRATLSFARERRGMAAWLASPSPMGSLDFVSPAASFTFSVVVEKPQQIIRQIFSLLGSEDSHFDQDLAEFESQSGVNVSEDLAGALGGGATFALDGPILPTPSWTLALEVNDPTLLQEVIEKLVARYNQQADTKSGPVNLTKEDVGGLTYYTLQWSPPKSPPGVPTEVDYVFVDGYLLAAPRRALLLSAMQNRETGYSLAGSADFMSRLPRDGYVNCSALIYQNAGAMLGPVLEELKSSPALTPAQRQSIEALSQNSTPSLTCVYGEPDRVVVANTGSLFGLGFDSLLGIGGAGPLRLLPVIESAAKPVPKGS